MNSAHASAAIFTSGGEDAHKYEQIPTFENERKETRSMAVVDEETNVFLNKHLKEFKSRNRRRLITMGISIIGLLTFLYWAIAGYSSRDKSCDSIDGFQCKPKLSQYWGQYSPYFAVPSEISSNIPEGCQITFAQILSRHGARDPTTSKSIRYAELVSRIHAKTTTYNKDYKFIKSYKYTLGSDQLSLFGGQQLKHSGAKYFNRYADLAKHTSPFVRASGQQRVIQSAQNWTEGFHSARLDSDPKAPKNYPYSMVIISEDPGLNNTLDHGLCAAFENSTTGSDAQGEWASIFIPPITARLNENLPGADIIDEEVIFFMDLCPFNTVASPLGKISPFCALFTELEWQSYDYYQSLGKYYGFSWGNTLGATQGVGFTNELIARLTNSPVEDHTSTNSTLDSDKRTFPIGKETTLFADFSHDNDMTSIFAALGLYNETRPLLKTEIEDTEETKGYSAAWTVPFAGRAYFEKMVCVGFEEELVRVLVNDRVLPLEICGSDAHGRCALGDFIKSLSYAKAGGEWDKCFPQGEE